MTLKSNSKQLWLQSRHEYSLKKPEWKKQPSETAAFIRAMMSLLPKLPSCLCQFLSPNVNLFFFSVFLQWDVGLVANGATESGIVKRGKGGKTRGGEGKKGEEGGEEGKGE